MLLQISRVCTAVEDRKPRFDHLARRQADQPELLAVQPHSSAKHFRTVVPLLSSRLGKRRTFFYLESQQQPDPARRNMTNHRSARSDPLLRQPRRGLRRSENLQTYSKVPNSMTACNERSSRFAIDPARTSPAALSARPTPTLRKRDSNSQRRYPHPCRLSSP